MTVADPEELFSATFVGIADEEFAWTVGVSNDPTDPDRFFMLQRGKQDRLIRIGLRAMINLSKTSGTGFGLTCSTLLPHSLPFRFP